MERRRHQSPLSIRGGGAGVRVNAGVVEALLHHCITASLHRRYGRLSGPGLMRLFPQTGLRLTSHSRPLLGCDCSAANRGAKNKRGTCTGLSALVQCRNGCGRSGGNSLGRQRRFCAGKPVLQSRDCRDARAEGRADQGNKARRSVALQLGKWSVPNKVDVSHGSPTALASAQVPRARSSRSLDRCARGLLRTR